MGLVFRVLFFVGNKPEIIRCARSPWSPIDTIRRGHDGSWSILTSSHRHEDTVSISDSFQIVSISPSWRVFIRQSWRVCSTRSPWSPSGPIRRGKDGFIVTHCYEGTISVRDSIKTIWCSRSPIIPRCTIWRGHDGSRLTHHHEDTVSIGDSNESFCWTRSPWSPSGSIRRGEDGSINTIFHEYAISVGDSIKSIWCPRSPWSPSDSMRRGEDGFTHRHEESVSIGDSLENVCNSRSS